MVLVDVVFEDVVVGGCVELVGDLVVGEATVLVEDLMVVETVLLPLPLDGIVGTETVSRT